VAFDRLSGAFGRALAALALLGCALLFAMMAVIVGDVLLRNVAVPGLPRGLSWSNEVSEFLLYVITLCVAPWLLRQGQHIRVDILLRSLMQRIYRSKDLVSGNNVVFAATGAIVAEFVGANSGLGYLLLRATSYLDMPLIFAVLVALSAIGILGSYAVQVLERLCMPWLRKR